MFSIPPPTSQITFLGGKMNKTILPKTRKSHNSQELIGRRFGRLVVTKTVRKKGRQGLAVVCDCGTKKELDKGNVVSGRTLSCGCLIRDIGRSRAFHGEYRNNKQSAEYAIYHGAKKRCQNPKDGAFKYYGERGVEFRFTSIEQFIADVGRRPSKEHSIDRKDTNGHYEPGNVRWATKDMQASNMRSNKFISIGGMTLTYSQWERHNGLTPNQIHVRKSRDWCDQCAVTKFSSKRGSCSHRPMPKYTI